VVHKADISFNQTTVYALSIRVEDTVTKPLNLKMTVFWDVAPCSHVVKQLVSFYVTTERNIPNGSLPFTTKFDHLSAYTQLN
jgi:hypothetical protein